MWADRSCDRPHGLRVLALAIAIIFSTLVLLPRMPDYGAAVTPTFTRPNVLVDSNNGWVGSSSPGGPSIAIDTGGKLHAVWMDNSSVSGDRGIYYANSSDGGLTWSTPQRRIDGFAGSNSYVPMIAIDKSGGPYTGRIYVAWQVLLVGQYHIYVISSSDGGITWSPLDRHQVDSGVSSATIPRIAVDTDGWIYVSFQDARNGNIDIFVARSSDGGATWLPDTQVSTSANGDAYSSLAALGGTVCAAWQEASVAATNLWLSCSTNRGNNWQTNAIISIPAGAGEARFASITVDPMGVVHAAFTKADATGETWIAYVQSGDRGATWTAITQVNDVPPSAIYMPNGVTIVQSSGILYVVWSDNRNGDNDIYASWSEDGGNTWGDGLLNNNDIRVDDTDENAPGDDATEQVSPSAAPGALGVYAIWSDRRSPTAYHAYFAGFEISEMIITEIRDSPNGMEQIELYNHGGRAIDLTGWGLMVDAVRVDLTPLGSIPASAYRTIGDPGTSNLQIDITLGDEGGLVELVNQLSVVKDSVAYGQRGPVPDPVASESVARVPFGGGYIAFWTRQPTSNFGSQNVGSQPIANPSLVLNEVLFNAAVANNRFIEFYFRGLGSVNIGGHVLVGDDIYVLPAVVLSAANPFYVVRPSQAPTLFGQLTATGDNLYLYDPGGALMDMVGWTSAHNQDLSMVRVPDGFGTAEGYNDPTSVTAGWRFNMVPSLPLVLIGPRQTKGGDLATRIFFVLTVTNKEPASAYANIEYQLGPQAWPVSLYMADGVTPLQDSPGDADLIPDTGILAPEGQIDIQVAVDIPSVPQVQDWETCSIIATISGDPLASASVPLTANIYPYEMPASSVNPSTIWLETAGPTYNPKETTVTLTVTGKGTAIFRQRPQDTVMMIDTSGSMNQNDPLNLRLTAAKHYVDLLANPDRAAILCFDQDVRAPNGDHLSSNYPRIKINIDQCQTRNMNTNLYDPIRLATNEILSYGNQSHVWVEILLTDGADTTGHNDAQILGEAQRAANNGIVIFTIGLVGTGGVNEPLLQQIAQLTGGIYLRAQSATDLDAIYQLIGQIVKNLAGYDNDVTDSIPMINVFLPNYVHLVGGTANPVPSYQGQFGGQTNMQWNVSKLSINETWTATFRVTSGLAGAGLGGLSVPDSIVTYIRYDDMRVSIPFPQIYIDVLEPPPRPVNYTITRSPLMGDVIVDGATYPAGSRFAWLPGDTHTIGAPDLDVIGPGERWYFVSWNDGGTLTHDITVGSSDATIIATYAQQFKPAVAILGLDSSHSVSAHFTMRGVPTSQPGFASLWSDWVDNGTALSFDALGANSNATERWRTQQNFGVAPWSAVTSAFGGSVLYWHQVTPTVIVQGIPSSITIPITSTVFGLAANYGTSSAWTDWVDHNTQLTVGGRVDVSAIERYVNLISRSVTLLQFTITNPATFTIPYMHQFKPVVCLIGTDPQHTVDVSFDDSSKDPAQSVTTNVSVLWTDWADRDSHTVFPNETTGSPNRHAQNETTMLVDSAFDACIVYAPPPRVDEEPNYKPLISLIFVVLLLIFGLFWGSKKPWDRYIPPQKGMKPEDAAKREAKLRKMSLTRKLQQLSLADLDEKFSHDRHWTIMTLALPFIVVESIIGVASLATGVFKVPEDGNWLSIGLIVNALLLMAGFVFDLLMQRRGYRVPSEGELAILKEEDLPKTGRPSKKDAKGKPAGGSKPEKVIGTLSGLQTYIGDFIVPRTYNLVFTEKRVICLKQAGSTELLGDEIVSSPENPEIRTPTEYDTEELADMLAEKRANFAIPYDSVEQANVGGILGKRIHIESTIKELRAEVSSSEISKVKTVLHQTLPRFGF